MKALARIAVPYRHPGSHQRQIAVPSRSAGSCRGHGSGAPSSRFRTAVAFCLVSLGALVFAPAPASAEVVHVLQPTSSGSFPFNGLSNPLGVAEDQSAHLIYVSDLSSGTIHKFTAEGKRQNFSALGSSELAVPSSPSLYQIGVDNSGGGSAGDIYVPDGANKRVDKFDPSGELDATTPYIGEGTLSGPTAVAVDGSGNVFVADNAAGVVDEFSSEGALLKTFGSGHLESLLAIAVGPAPEENVYVGTYNDGLVEFEHSGGCVNSCKSFDPYQILGVGIDTHGNVFASNTGDAVGEFTSTGTLLEYFGSAAEFFGQPGGVAIDSTTEDVYVADAPQSVVKVFKPFPANRLTVSVSGVGSGDVTSNPGSIFCGTPYGSSCAENFKEGTKVTLTAEPNGAVPHSKFAGWSGECAAEHGDECEVELTAARSVEANFEKLIFPETETEASSEVTPTSATLNGKVNPGGKPLTECFFEYGGWGPYGSWYQFGPVFNHKAECEPAFGSITGTSPVSVKAKVSVTGPVHFRLVATNENGSSTGSEQVVPIPVAEADTVREINGEGKTTVFGTLEPSGADTHYHFEFVTEEQFKEGNWSEALSTPSQDAGSGTGREGLAVEAPKLEPETGYDFRVAAESAALPGHTVYSPVKTIPKPHALEPTPENCPNEADRYGASARLPDCRAYEQVTPAEKEGAQEAFGFGHGFDPDTSTATDGESFLMTNIVSKWTNNVGSVLETYVFRRTPSGWQIHSLNPQPESRQYNNDLYHMYNNEFSNFLVTRTWATSFSNQSPFKEYAMGPPGGPYVVAAKEPNIEGHFGEWHGQSRDGKLGVIETADHELIPGHPTKTVGESWEHPDIYAYSARTGLVQVNVESNGEPIGTNGTCGAYMAQGREEGERGGDRTLAGNGGNSTGGVNSISADGSKIFFYDSPGECARREELISDTLVPGTRLDLYMREPFAGKTYDLGHWTFEGANPEGTRLLLGKYGPQGAEYYSYNTETKEAKHAFSTPYPIDEGPTAISEDGSVIYFSNIFELNQEATVAANLWRYDLNTETLTWVERLTGTHGGPYGSNTGTTEHGEGYFIQKEVGPNNVEQEYFYDSNEQMVTCVSCDSPFDPNPVQPSFPVETGSGNVNNYGPIVTPASANGDYMLFETANALLPNDINGELEPSGFDAPFSPSDDIYEWRRHGIDGCTAPQGCLALITDGISGGKKELLGVSPTGRDIFFATESQLVAQDKDSVSDVYDARIDGGYPPPPPLPLQCEGDACHNPTNPPNDPTPSSSVYEGPGNEHPTPPKEEAKPKKHKRHNRKHHKRSHRRAAGHGSGGRK